MLQDAGSTATILALVGWTFFLAAAAIATPAFRHPPNLDMASASLDYYRAIRDAVSEAMFFSVYGTMFATGLEDKPPADQPFEVDPRESSIIPFHGRKPLSLRLTPKAPVASAARIAVRAPGMRSDPRGTGRWSARAG